jgi:hypothetical protein
LLRDDSRQRLLPPSLAAVATLEGEVIQALATSAANPQVGSHWRRQILPSMLDEVVLSSFPCCLGNCGHNVDVCAGFTKIIHNNPVQNIQCGPTSGDVIDTVVNTSSVIFSEK